MSDSFADQWRELLAHGSAGKKEVEYGQPLRLVYGATETAKAVFFWITATKPGLPDLSGAVAVERGVRKLDGKWTLSLTLRDDRLLDVFMNLCEDLARRSSVATSETHALTSLLEGLADWKHLLRTMNGEHASSEAIRGLVAEMWFGFTQLTRDLSHGEVLRGWTGPLGRPQDFNFRGGISYEVKSCFGDSKSLRISSADQLDPGDRTLTLAAVTLEGAAPKAADAISIGSLNTLVIEHLGGQPADVAQLQQCFESLRIDPLDDYYDDYWFVVHGCRLFGVVEEFPAIRMSELRPGIDRVEYSVSFSSIAQYEIVS
jgi:hypothetical protein